MFLLCSHTTTTLNPSAPEMWGFSPHQPILGHQLVSYNSAQSDSTYLEIVLDPKGQPLSLSRLPPSPLQMPITGPGCPPCLISYQSEVPATSLDSVDLLERLTELRKTVYQFILKGWVTDEHPDGREVAGKVREWAQSFHRAFSRRATLPLPPPAWGLLEPFWDWS